MYCICIVLFDGRLLRQEATELLRRRTSSSGTYEISSKRGAALRRTRRYYENTNETSRRKIRKIGGNDISPISDPEVIFNNIRDLIEKLEETDVRRVYISEILPRGDFSKSKPRGLTKAKFDSDKKAINKLMFKEYGTRIIKFHDIRYPRDYHSDKVHLSEPTQDSKKCGLRK